MELNFSFEGRTKPGMLGEVGRILLEIVPHVPGGVVCFFPSYQCLSDCRTVLAKDKMLDKLSKVKTLYFDEAGRKNSDDILGSYASCIQRAESNPNSLNTGAIFNIFIK